MSSKIPYAKVKRNQIESALAKYATNIYTLMGSTEGLILFPSPTVPLATLVITINSYTTALGAAIKGVGSKNDTQVKNSAKELLIQQLTINALYVSEQAQNVSGLGTNIPNPTIIAQMSQIITASGYTIGIAPSPVANTTGIPVPIQKKAISKAIGSVHFLLRQYTAYKKGVKTWIIRIRLVNTVSPLPWQTFTITSSNMTITGLTSGLNEYQIAAQGGKNTKNFSINPLNWSAVQQVVVT